MTEQKSKSIIAVMDNQRANVGGRDAADTTPQTKADSIQTPNITLKDGKTFKERSEARGREMTESLNRYLLSQQN